MKRWLQGDICFQNGWNTHRGVILTLYAVMTVHAYKRS